MSVLLVSLDITIVNVALPSLHTDLGATVAGLQWIIDAYTVVLASLLLLAGSAGDRFGRRRVFQIGVVLFTLGSALCALAPSPGWLIVFRILQAIGGSMLNPVAMAIITNTVQDPRERAQAIGVWGSVIGLGIAAGPILGGFLVGTVGWRAIFWVNVPVGLTALTLTAVLVPESRAPQSRRFDPVGQILVIATLASLTYAIIEGPARGWRSPLILSSLTGTVVAASTLAYYERRRADPLIEPRFFRSVPFRGALVTGFCAWLAVAGFLFLNTVYLQEVRGLSAMSAGLHALPMAVMTLVCPALSGRVVGRRGPRTMLIVAGAGIAAGSAMLTRLTPDTSYGWLFTAYAAIGVGAGSVGPPVTNTAVSGMPSAQAGVAAAVASTSRQVGQSVGVAVVGAAARSQVRGPLRDSFAQASHTGWWITTACGLLIVLLGMLTTTRWAMTTAARVAGGGPSDRRGQHRRPRHLQRGRPATAGRHRGRPRRRRLPLPQSAAWRTAD